MMSSPPWSPRHVLAEEDANPDRSHVSSLLLPFQPSMGRAPGPHGLACKYVESPQRAGGNCRKLGCEAETSCGYPTQVPGLARPEGRPV